MQKTRTFGTVFKYLRKRAGYKTLSSFVDSLANHGLTYTESILSRWQKDSRLPKDRAVFLTLIKIFIKRKSIVNIYQANELLALAGKGYLTSEEIKGLLVDDNLSLEMSLYEQKDVEKEINNNNLVPVPISLKLPQNLHRYLDYVSERYKTSKAEVMRGIIDRQHHRQLSVD